MADFAQSTINQGGQGMQDLKLIADMFASIFGVIGGITAAGLAIYQLRKDFRWKKAGKAKEVLERYK